LQGEAPQNFPDAVLVAALPPPAPHHTGILAGLRPAHPRHDYSP